MDAVDAWHALITAYGTLSAKMCTVLDDAYRVSLPEFEALLWIDRSGDEPISAIDLTDRLLLTQSGATRLVGRLERAGYVTRTASSADARRKDIALTDRGRSAITDMRKIHAAQIRDLIGEHLSDREIDQLTELLRKLVPGS